ncbi:MAG: glycosyltransferase family 4 protein [Myxococcota bacterium]
MRRVLIASFDRVPSPKGASQHILATFDALRERADPSLLTLGDAPIPGINHLTLNIQESNWLRRAMRFSAEVRAIVERRGFDVYHVRSPWEGLAIPYGEPLLYEVNGLASIETPYHHPDMSQHPSLREKLRRLELALLDRATRIITPSSVTAGYLTDLGVSADRIDVVPNKPSFAPRENTAPSDGPVRLVYHGTLTAWQGLHDLIHGLSRLRSLAWTLTILTGTHRQKWLKRLIRKRALADRIVVRSALPAAELGAFLAGCHLGVAPLTPCERNLIQGCMPIKILDAMAAGLPVLAPDIPVVRDILGEDFPTYAAWSRTNMTSRLEAWITDAASRRSWGARNRSRVTSMFSADEQRRRLQESYQRL